MPEVHQITRNLAAVRARLEQAARTAGRDPATIRLVAVSKNFPPEAVLAAASAGQLDFGENRVQEGLQKIAATADHQIRWHLIGHLQSNKAKRAAQAFAFVHSIDSVELLRRIDDAATEIGQHPTLLVQVDLAGETTKFGAPEAELPAIFAAAGSLRSARLAGLMVLPPYSDDPEGARPWFRRLREAAGHPSPAGRIARHSSRALHGYEPRFPCGHRRGRDDRAGRHGDIW